MGNTEFNIGEHVIALVRKGGEMIDAEGVINSKDGSFYLVDIGGSLTLVPAPRIRTAEPVSEVQEPVSKKPRKKVDKADAHPPIPSEGNKPEPVPLDTEVNSDQDMVNLGEELNPQENAVLSPSDEPALEPDTESKKEEIVEPEPPVKRLGIMSGRSVVVISANDDRSMTILIDGERTETIQYGNTFNHCGVVYSVITGADGSSLLQVNGYHPFERKGGYFGGAISSLLISPEPPVESEFKFSDTEIKITQKPFVTSDVIMAVDPVTNDVVAAKLDELAADQDKWMKAIRYDAEFLGYQSEYKIYGRQRVGGLRNYVVAYEGDQYPRFMVSCTSFMEMVLPKPKALFEWAVNSFRNMQEYRAYMDEKAAIGTVIHGAIADLTNGVLEDFSDDAWWDQYLKSAFARTEKPDVWRGYKRQVFKALLSFIQYVQDYEVRIIALEIPVASRSRHMAGQIDLVVERNAYIQAKTGKNAGTPPRVICVDDIKTGDAHDFYAPQLGIYGEMLLETFPALSEKIRKDYPHQVVDGKIRLHHGIFVPSDWRKPPSRGKGYKLSMFNEKVYSFMDDEYNTLHQVFLMRIRDSRLGGETKFKGKPEIGMNIGDVVKYRPLHEVWAERIANGETGGDVDAVETEEGEESTDE